MITIILLALIEVSFGQNELDENLIDQGLLLEECDFLLKTLEETHPNLYAYIPKEKFIEKTNEFRASISGPMSKPEFYKILYKTIALVKQGHTMVFGDAGYRDFLKSGGLAFPFKISYNSSHIYIDENFSDLNKSQK